MLSRVMHDISGFQSPVRFIPQPRKTTSGLTDKQLSGPSEETDVEEMGEAFWGDLTQRATI